MSSKRTYNLELVACSLFAVTLFFALPVQAQNVTYNLISPLPGGTNQVSGENIFPQYARQLFAFALSAAAVLAFGMLVVGSIQYIASAGNESILKDAKDRIWNALIGLLLALAAWLILNTINPALISNDIQIPKIEPGPGRIDPGPTALAFCINKVNICVAGYSTAEECSANCPKYFPGGNCVTKTECEKH